MPCSCPSFTLPSSRILQPGELAILRSQVHRPAVRPADRWFLAVASRPLPRVKRSVFLVSRQRCWAHGLLRCSFVHAGKRRDRRRPHPSVLASGLASLQESYEVMPRPPGPSDFRKISHFE
jgi:hypothetical protein